MHNSNKQAREMRRDKTIDKTREKRDLQSNDKQGTADSEKGSRQQSEMQSRARDNDTLLREKTSRTLPGVD